MLASW